VGKNDAEEKKCRGVILGKNDLKSPLTGKGRRKLKEKKLGPA
jgi:hypothetical protein